MTNEDTPVVDMEALFNSYSQEDIDIAVDKAEKIAKLGMEKGIDVTSLLVDMGNFSSFPTESFIRSNPNLVKKLDADLMRVFETITR